MKLKEHLNAKRPSPRHVKNIKIVKSQWQRFLKAAKKKDGSWEFPGGPVVRTQCFYCQGPGLIPGRGTKILQATWRGQKGGEKKKKAGGLQRNLH